MSDPQRALDNLLASDLDPQVRREIDARCDAGEPAADILESVDSVHLLAATAGAQALTEAEADDLFAGILGAMEVAPIQPAEALPKPANNMRRYLAAVAVAAVALLAVQFYPRDQSYTGIKGVDTLSAPALRVFLGDRAGGIDREIGAGEAVAAGSPVLFRYTTHQAARAVLLVDEGGSLQTAWVGPEQPPGEHELTTDGQALAWTVDGPTTFGLRLVRPDGDGAGLDMLDDCGPSHPCTRFAVGVD
jgi:hypothetical protein